MSKTKTKTNYWASELLGLVATIVLVGVTAYFWYDTDYFWWVAGVIVAGSFLSLGADWRRSRQPGQPESK